MKPSRQTSLDLQAINRIVADQTKTLRARVDALEGALTSVRDIAIAMDDSQRSYRAPTIILAEGGDRIKRIANDALRPSPPSLAPLREGQK